MSKEKPPGPPKEKKARGKKEDREAATDDASADKSIDPNMPGPTHLFVGLRDVPIKMDARDLVRVMRGQQELQAEYEKQGDRLRSKQTQIDEAQEVLAQRRAEFRQIESDRQETVESLLDMIKANKDGQHIERIEVDEIFLNGEVVTYRQGTKEEVGLRRNATAAEYEVAQGLKTEDKPLSRWQPGKPGKRPGLVLLDGGKEVPGSGSFGYVGPTADPRRAKPDDEKPKKKGRPKKDKGAKVLPHSLKSVPDDDDGKEDAEVTPTKAVAPESEAAPAPPATVDMDPQQIDSDLAPSSPTTLGTPSTGRMRHRLPSESKTDTQPNLH